MTLTRSLLNVFEKRAVYASDVWSRWASGDDLPSAGTAAGVHVNRDAGLRLAVAFACIRMLSEDVASLPVGVFTRDDDTRSRLPKPRWMVNPNGEMNWFELVQQSMAGLLTDGNAPLEIVRDRFQEPIELWPLDPQRVEAQRASRGDLTFRVVREDGQTYTLSPPDILFVRGFTLPGQLQGLSPIAYARETIGMGLAAERYGAGLFGNGAYAGGVIQFPGDASDEQVDEFVKRWKKHHSGVRNAHEPGVLTGGAKWQQVTIPPEDAQFIETRKFSVEEVARFYRVPPHKVGHLERATFSNIEQQSIEYVVDSIRTWLVRLEAALTSLLPAGQFPKWNVEGLLRGDTLNRYQAYTQARNAGWLSVNEIRALEDMNPIPDGDDYLQPLNMGPLGINPLEEQQ